MAHAKSKGAPFASPFDVVFSFHDVVEPDLVFVAPEVKRRLYENAGVRE